MIERLKRDEQGMVSDGDIIKKIDELVDMVNGMQKYMEYSAGMLEDHGNFLNLLIEGIRKTNSEIEEISKR